MLVTEFEGWASVDADPTMKFDWDDLAGDAKRREAGLKLVCHPPVSRCRPHAYSSSRSLCKSASFVLPRSTA